jgi:pyruvate/2-oxoglutarate dehydrogenase complex dihydrolipoamide dehydrogenase (E3) component
LKGVTQIQGRVLISNYDTSAGVWTTVIETNGQQHLVKTNKFILAQGSEPKSMNLSIPTIPLQTALDITRLKHYVKPEDKVLVFGTMHSGTLAIQNLASLGANVIAYYKHDKPFYWDRDNVYDGIKAEAAEIADKIIAGSIPVSLVSTNDTEKVIRTSRDAKWVVYAIGFAPRQIHITVDGSHKTTEYDGLTGRLLNAPAWGFGIAYPNRAPDGIHWDVSVAAFLEHMKSQLPAMNT